MNVARWVAFSILLTSLWSCWAPTGATTGDDGEDGSLSVGSAHPAAMLARLCGYLPDQPLCIDPPQQMAFIELHELLKSILPGALATPGDYLDFAEGRGDAYEFTLDLVTLDNPLFEWTPVVIPGDVRPSLEAEFSP